jgi:hypothetical protein
MNVKEKAIKIEQLKDDNELTELKKQKLRNEDHYDLLIRAQQAINGDKNE